MMYFRPHPLPGEVCPRTLVPGTIALAFAAVVLVSAAAAQDADAPKEKTLGGFAVHQSVDLGGHIVDYSGSRGMYDTLVNLQTGPRILSHSLEMHAVSKTKYPFFDTLMTTSSGYGGDPENFTMFRMSKGKLYDFRGLFRRDRQYFDYNLLDNPLVPAGVTSNGYTYPQVLDSPHLFNSVRRMTDVNLTMLPLSTVSYRFGYSQNINQGPTYSSIHHGQEFLLFQNWRNSTDSFYGAVDFKPFSRTTLTYEELVSHYKGDTNYGITGLNLQLADGTPVTQGFDNTATPTCTDTRPAILNSTTKPPTANDTCDGYLGYRRYAPTRTISPTEEFLFQSSNIKNIQVNGRVRYTGANLNLPNYSEYFNGLENSFNLRVATITGYGKARRINVSADLGVVWQLSDKLSLSEQYDFWNSREPANNYIAEVDQGGASLLTPPDPAQPASITPAQTSFGLKTETNTISAAWRVSPQASLSIGYRYRARRISLVMPLSTDALPNGTAYSLNYHDNGGLLGITLHPSPKLRMNGNVEVAWSDNAYVQTSPRALQHYQFRTTYKARDWATISATFNDLERRNNVLLVNHLDHSRSFTAGTSITPNERYGLDLNYGYIDVASQTVICYAGDPAYAGPGAGAPPADCGTNTILGNARYDAPTQYGSIGITWEPVKKLRSTLGYRMSAVNGTTALLNPLDVPGSLQSEYESPFATVAWTIAPGWAWKADWNYYGYGEGGPAGPTAPRTFRGSVYTLAVHHDF